MMTRSFRPAHAYAVGCVVLLLLVGSRANDTPQETAGPSITCDERTYDFGTVLSEGFVRHAFVIRNAGQAPLAITRATGCCGMSVVFTNSTIAPGNSATLIAQLPLKGLSGKILKTVLIESNDPKQPAYSLLVVGNVIVPFELEPRLVNFSQVPNQAQVERSVSLRPMLDFRIEDVASTVPGLDATWIRRTNLYLITIYTKPPLPYGITSGCVRIQTDNALFRSIEIPVFLDVPTDFVTVPSEILVVVRDMKQSPLSYSAIIRSRSQSPFKILQVSAPDQGIQVKFHSTSLGEYRLDIENITLCLELNGKKILVSTDQRQRQIEIPVRAIEDSPQSF